MPSLLSRQVRSSLFARLSPSSAAFPVKKSGRLLQLLFRDLLGVHSTLWPARSRSRLATLSIESSDSFVASAAVSIATGWNEPVPGRELHPLKSSAFHGALFRQQAPWEIILNHKRSEHMRTFVLICLVVVAFQSFAQNEASGMNGLVLSPDGKPMEGTLPVRNSKLRL